jgi:hypothetical protein
MLLTCCAIGVDLLLSVSASFLPLVAAYRTMHCITDDPGRREPEFIAYYYRQLMSF